MTDLSISPLMILARRLQAQAPLSHDDLAAILALPATVRKLRPAAYILREGEPPTYCAILKSGFAMRQKLTQEGARQIVALNILGDPLDCQTLYLDAVDHNAQTLTAAEVVTVPRAAIQQLIEHRPAIAHAVFVNVLIEASISREWLVNIGRRDARGRLAHLLCEFAMRMEAQGLAGPDGYEIPMTQEQLGDALSLTSVHVNRTLRALEAEGVIRRTGRRISFESRTQVERIADFSPLYLHLDASRQAERISA